MTSHQAPIPPRPTDIPPFPLAPPAASQDVYLPQGYPLSVTYVHVPPGVTATPDTPDGQRSLAQLAGMTEHQLRDLVRSEPVIGWLIRPDRPAPRAITPKGVVEELDTTIGRIRKGGAAVMINYSDPDQAIPFFVRWLLSVRSDARATCEQHEITYPLMD